MRLSRYSLTKASKWGCARKCALRVRTQHWWPWWRSVALLAMRSLFGETIWVSSWASRLKMVPDLQSECLRIQLVGEFVSVLNPVISGWISSRPSKPGKPSSTIQSWPDGSSTRTSQLRPTTNNPGGLLPSSSTAVQILLNVLRMTRWSGQLALSSTAHGVATGHGAGLRGKVPSPFTTDLLLPGTRPVRLSTSELSLWSDIRKIAVCAGTYGGGSGAAPFLPVPVQIRTWSATLRWVDGIFANRGALSELVIPGRTVGGYPLSRKKANSSPPRPYMYGSPCLSRSTVWPFSRASSPRLRSSVCAASALPGNLRAMWTGVRRGIRSSTGAGTSLSARMTDAVWIARCVAKVRRAGEPGPEPARLIRGCGRNRVSRTEVSRGGTCDEEEEYACRIWSMSASVMEASRRRGQYSQIWESQRMRRVLAAAWSVSETSWLNVGFWAVASSSSTSTSGSSEAWALWSSSHILRRTVPRRSTAVPKPGGSVEAISRRIRDASLHPLPDVVIPIWSGPSEWVERIVKEQRFGASTTLMGMRKRRHSAETLLAAKQSVPGFGSKSSISTFWCLPSWSHKHCIDDVVHLFSTQSF